MNARFPWFALLLLSGKLGCDDDARTTEPVCESFTQRWRVAAKTKIDLLFVVRDAGSMAEEQEKLARDFGLLGRELFDWAEYVANFRVAVVASGASDPKTLGRFREPILRSGPADRGGNFGDDRDAFSDRLVALGQLGASGGARVEQGLEAVRRALSCDGPNAAMLAGCPSVPAREAEFGRPDALLFIGFVADRDDCSCQGNDCDRYADPNECAWSPDGLVPVSDYVDFLGRQKAEPRNDIVVASITGPRAVLPSPDGQGASEVRVTRGVPAEGCQDEARPGASVISPECCPAGVCVGEPAPTCATPAGEAYAGRRYLELADALGLNGFGCPVGAEVAGAPCYALCDGAISHPIESYIFDRTDRTLSDYCLEVPPRCVVPDVQGAPARPCENEAERADARNRASSVEVVWSCPPPEAGGACETTSPPTRVDPTKFEVISAVACPTGFAIFVAEDVPPGADVEIRWVQIRPVDDFPPSDQQHSMRTGCKDGPRGATYRLATEIRLTERPIDEQTTVCPR